MESSSSGHPPSGRRRDRFFAAAASFTSRPLSTLFRSRSASLTAPSAQHRTPSLPDVDDNPPLGVIHHPSDPRLRQPGNRDGMHFSLSPILQPPLPHGFRQPGGNATPPAPPAPISSPLPVHPQPRALTLREPSNPQPGYGAFRAAAVRSGVDACLLQPGNRSGLHNLNVPLLKTHCLGGLYPPAPAQYPPSPPVAQVTASPSVASPSINLAAQSRLLQPPTSATMQSESDAQRERQLRRATWTPTIHEDIELGHGDASSTRRNATPPPILRTNSQRLPPTSNPYSGQPLSLNSPLSSISLLLSHTASNMSIGAAHAANHTFTGDDSSAQQEAQDPTRPATHNGGTFGWLHQARARLSRGSTSFRPRPWDLHTILRNNHTHTSLEGEADENTTVGAIVTHDDMPSFTIVGIRRISTNGENEDIDFLPPYLRDLIGPTEEIDDEDESIEGYFPHERRRSIFRIGRQRSRPRSLYGSGSLRRNGVVEPDPSTTTQGPPRHAYVLYVIRATLPEGHPLLSEPNLLSDELTHETMLRIGSVLGQVKRPVASENEVLAAGGVFVVEIEAVEDGADKFVAVSREGKERFAIPPFVEDNVERPERCNICLGDYQRYEELRKLNVCGHYFHADCIKLWLTEGRNSCPLCRGEGVNKKSSSTTEGPSSVPA